MVILEESLSIDDRWAPKPRISILACIPAYNAEATIAKVLVKARDRVSRMVVCDDYSSDMTSQIASAFGAIVLKHDASMGYNAALSTLLDFARGTDADIIVTLDADGSHDPVDITRIVEPISNGTADIVIGSRFVENSNAPIELVDDRPKKSFSNGKVRDPASGFRAYSRKALKLILPIERDALIKTKILEKAKVANLRVVEVPIEMGEKEAPAPAVPLAKVSTPTEKNSSSRSEGLRSYSMEHPVLLFGAPGIVALIIGLGFGVLAILGYLNNGITSIPLTMMAAGGVFLGLLLLAVMIIVWIVVGAVNRR